MVISRRAEDARLFQGINDFAVAVFRYGWSDALGNAPRQSRDVERDGYAPPRRPRLGVSRIALAIRVRPARYIFISMAMCDCTTGTMPDAARRSAGAAPSIA